MMSAVLTSYIYRHLQVVGDIIDMASCERKSIIVTGDFNCDVWENDASVHSDPILLVLICFT